MAKYPDEFKYVQLPDFEMNRFRKTHGTVNIRAANNRRFIYERVRVGPAVRINTEMSSYADTRAEFIKNNNLIVLPEVFLAIWSANVENLLLNEKQLFSTELTGPVTLEEFSGKQLETISLVGRRCPPCVCRLR